jgi:hypothetical protein
MWKYLSVAEVAELAELLEDAPNRVGVIDEVLQVAAEGRGMTLRLIKLERELEICDAAIRPQHTATPKAARAATSPVRGGPSAGIG